MADRRNLDWKTNNVGSKLLAKMGWKDGQGVGKRCRDDDEKQMISTEGIRVKRRQTNLGLGATTNHTAILGTVSGSNHAEDFAMALVEFQKIHGVGPGTSSGGNGNDVNDKNNDDDGAMTSQKKQEDKKKKKSKDKKKNKEKKKENAKDKDQNKKKKKDLIVLPTNKITHSAIRQAKFQAKTRDDLKCIFAGSAEAVYSSTTTEAVAKQKKKKTTNRKR
jgi:G-patch domain